MPAAVEQLYPDYTGFEREEVPRLSITLLGVDRVGTL